MREHSSLSRGHRRCAHEPTYSRSRRVVISFVSFVSNVDTTCANADTSRTSSGVRSETARRTSTVYSSYTISSHRRCRRRRGRARARRVRRRSCSPTSPPSRLARARRAHRQSLRTLESRRRVFAVVSTARRVDGASSPVSSRSRSRARVLIATFSIVDLTRASSVHYVLNARDTVIARARRVLSTASSFCARATRHLISSEVRRIEAFDFETMRESRVASPKTKMNRRARTKNERHASQR